MVRLAIATCVALYVVGFAGAGAQSQLDVAAQISSVLPDSCKRPNILCSPRNAFYSVKDAVGVADGTAGVRNMRPSPADHSTVVVAPNTLSATTNSKGSAGDVSGLGVTVGSVSRTLADRARDVIYAVDYGVKCDGSTDDGPAILTATNTAVWLGGRDVVFPAGTCLLKTGIMPPSGTRWISRGGTVIKAAPDMTLVGQLHVGIAFENVNNILLDGIVLQGAGSDTPPCGDGCAGLPRITAINVNGAIIRNTVIRDWGNLNVASDGKVVAYAQGIVAFGGSNWLVDHSSFINNSADGLSFSNGTDGVEVRSSYFDSNNDSSGVVCTIGGKNFNIHDNEVHQRVGNTSPIIVMDRCTNWNVTNNRIYGVRDASGNQTGQGIRVARYPVSGSANVSHDFAISNNLIIGTARAISVESAGTVQAGYKDNTGRTWPDANVPGGGRFAITGNTSFGANVCINVADSEYGTITGNTCTNSRDNGILLVSYAKATGSITINGNVLSGTGTSGSFGLRQLSAGGVITGSAIGPQVISGFQVASSLSSANPPLALPVVTRATTAPCNRGEVSMKADGSALQVCAGYGVVKSIPLQ